MAVAAACSAPVAEERPVARSSSTAPPGLGQPAPESPPPPPPVGTSAVLLCREAWGAQPPRPGGLTHTIDRMTLHHSGVALPDNRQIAARLRQHQRHHQDGQGWIDIAYHISVDHHGNIFQLRDTALAGDTATGYDTAGHFLLLCEGNFEEEPVPEAQIHSAAVVFAWAAQTFGIGSETLASHRDVSPGTECPGENLYQYITTQELKHRIDSILAAGPVQLDLVCGEQAAQIVAEIESVP